MPLRLETCIHTCKHGWTINPNWIIQMRHVRCSWHLISPALFSYRWRETMERCFQSCQTLWQSYVHWLRHHRTFRTIVSIWKGESQPMNSSTFLSLTSLRVCLVWQYHLAPSLLHADRFPRACRWLADGPSRKRRYGIEQDRVQFKALPCHSSPKQVCKSMGRAYSVESLMRHT